MEERARNGVDREVAVDVSGAEVSLVNQLKSDISFIHAIKCLRCQSFP